jgi:[ribosomal protein S5]-alanine N-acetyltransferase
LGENYWGRGITVEALKQMTDYVFQNFPELERLWAAVFEYNKPSMRVLEKAGYEFEGIRKKAAIKNGVVIDEYVYVKFRE